MLPQRLLLLAAEAAPTAHELLQVTLKVVLRCTLQKTTVLDSTVGETVEEAGLKNVSNAGRLSGGGPPLAVPFGQRLMGS